MRRAKIAGLGFYVPEKVVTNFDLEKMMDTSNEWIIERTGIRERHFVEGDVGATDLAVPAVKMALEDAGKEIEDIDFIIFATLSPDYMFPGNGAFLQPKLGIKDVGALDIRNQCTGFIYGLSVADQFIKTGMYDCILLVGGEVHSTGLNMTTAGRDVAVLFGDGAGAAIITPAENETEGILSTVLHADGRYAKELWLEDPASCKQDRLTHEMIDNLSIYPVMNGRTVFKHAVTKFPGAILESLEKAGKDISEVDLVVPHQANQRITEAIRHKLKLPEEKVFSNIHKYGNTTAASIPIAMTEAKMEGKIKPGSLVSLAAFGSGFTWGGAIVQF
jgi:3-oxoacyl-[acyl-carrier-protein] synthase-3